MVISLVGTSSVSAQSSAVVNIYVKETAGIRRNGYPVNARVPFPKAVLKDSTQARLILNDTEVPAQIAAESRWPDGYVQWLSVDFNASVRPLEELTYRLEYGDRVKQAAAPRGLVVTQTDEAIQVGNVRFNKKGSPLVLSVRYRQEDVGSGANGFVVTDNSGAAYDLSEGDTMKVEVVKPGPLYAVVRYTGQLAIAANYKVPFAITIEMPNSKTWVKYTASVEDKGKRLRDITFNAAFLFSGLPWLWDFGTGSWTYGALRNANESVLFTQVVKAGANDWQIRTGPKGQEQLYETGASYRPKLAEGWGHFQDSREVIAFGIDKFGRQPGTYTVGLDAQGQASFRFASTAAPKQEISVYLHYVASPTPIGAVTSPVSMLYGLTAVCDRSQYTRAGLPMP
jgi:hypothetical protein